MDITSDDNNNKKNYDTGDNNSRISDNADNGVYVMRG